jgi:hypothetical protein
MKIDRLTNDHRNSLRDAAFSVGDQIHRLTELINELTEAGLHQEAGQVRALRDDLDNARNLHALWRVL